MPAYDYACDRCQQSFEVRQRISEPPLTACIHCGGPARRLLAPAAFILKGGGWYVTDYPSEARKKAMESEKKTASEPAAAPSTGSTASPSSATSTPAAPSTPSTTS